MLQQLIDTPFDIQVERLRAVFQLPEEDSIPLSNVRSLLRYRDYLTAHLSFPFQALYAECKPPVRHLVRYITVVGLLDTVGLPLEGIVCKVDGLQPIRELPLVEIGVREDNPNFQAIDDYAYWFLNWR